MRKYDVHFESTVRGIPCGVHITEHEPGTNRMITSASLEPNAPPEVGFIVTDRHGFEAPWLERKMFAVDYERIEDEALRYLQQGRDEE